MRIAVLGLGRMGRELTPHLLAGGHQVTVFNRTDGATRANGLDGATVAGSAAEAVAGAEVVVTVLFGPDAVREVIIDGGISLPAGLLWIDVTTISAADAAEFSDWAGARNVRYVHAPVVGSLAPARAGMLGVLLGGAADAVEDASRITAAWADPTRVHRFDSVSQAAAAKLVVNLGLAVAMQGLAEALQLGRSLDLSVEKILAVLDKTPLAGVVAAKGDTVRSGTFTDAQFTVDALAKDALMAAAATTAPLAALSAAYEALSRQQENGHGDWDFSAVTAEA